MNKYYFEPGIGYVTDLGCLYVYDFGNNNFFVRSEKGDQTGAIKNSIDWENEKVLNRIFFESPSPDEFSKCDENWNLYEGFGEANPSGNDLVYIERDSLEEALDGLGLKHDNIEVKSKSWKQECIRYLSLNLLYSVLDDENKKLIGGNFGVRMKLLEGIFGEGVLIVTGNDDGDLNGDILACGSLEELKDKVEAKAKKILEESTENQ